MNGIGKINIVGEFYSPGVGSMISTSDNSTVVWAKRGDVEVSEIVLLQNHSATAPTVLVGESSSTYASPLEYPVFTSVCGRSNNPFSVFRNDGGGLVLDVNNELSPSCITLYSGKVVNQDPSLGDDVLEGSFVGEDRIVYYDNEQNTLVVDW